MQIIWTIFCLHPCIALLLQMNLFLLLKVFTSFFLQSTPLPIDCKAMREEVLWDISCLFSKKLLLLTVSTTHMLVFAFLRAASHGEYPSIKSPGTYFEIIFFRPYLLIRLALLTGFKQLLQVNLSFISFSFLWYVK